MLLAGVIFGVMLLVYPAYAADKLGYVDLGKIFSEYNKTKDYDKVLEGKETAYKTEITKKLDDYKQQQDKVELLSDKEKEAKTKELQAQFKTLQEFDQQRRADLRKEQDERMQEILKDIQEAIKKHSEKEGYTLVFNSRVLVYQTVSMDFSDKIIEMLNKAYKK